MSMYIWLWVHTFHQSCQLYCRLRSDIPNCRFSEGFNHNTNRNSSHLQQWNSIITGLYHTVNCGMLWFLAVKRLRSHMRCHGEKTFACDLCMKKFTMRAQLVRHQLVHSGVKAFVCPYCTYRSAIVENLRKHCHAVHKVLYPPKKRDVARSDDLATDRVSAPGCTTVQGCLTSADCTTSTLEGCTTTALTLLPVNTVLTSAGPDVGHG